MKATDPCAPGYVTAFTWRPSGIPALDGRTWVTQRGRGRPLRPKASAPLTTVAWLGAHHVAHPTGPAAWPPVPNIGDQGNHPKGPSPRPRESLPRDSPGAPSPAPRRHSLPGDKAPNAGRGGTERSPGPRRGSRDAACTQTGGVAGHAARPHTPASPPGAQTPPTPPHTALTTTVMPSFSSGALS